LDGTSATVGESERRNLAFAEADEDVVGAAFTGSDPLALRVRDEPRATA
jgi:hypothetical protein